MYCPECGHHNREAARFCGRCGASLLDPDAGEPTMSFEAVDEDGADGAAGDEPGEGATLVIRVGGGRNGEQFAVDREHMTIGRAPQSDVFLDDITVSREHAIARRTVRRPSADRPRQPERHVREPAADRERAPVRRRRAPDRQVPAHLHRAGAVAVSAKPAPAETPPVPADHRDGVQDAARRVRGHLDLEDPFPGGSEADHAAADARRLPAVLARTTSSSCATILRMQRDEFLPLRVIRQVIAQGRSSAATGRRPRLVGSGTTRLSLDQLLSRPTPSGVRARASRVPAAGRRAARRSGKPYTRPTSRS